MQTHRHHGSLSTEGGGLYTYSRLRSGSPLASCRVKGERVEVKKRPGRATATAKAALVSPKRILRKLQDCLLLRSPSVLMAPWGESVRSGRIRARIYKPRPNCACVHTPAALRSRVFVLIQHSYGSEAAYDKSVPAATPGPPHEAIPVAGAGACHDAFPGIHL